MRWPDVPISLHFHDTRRLAVANAYAGLKMGVTQFDSTVGGLGGCPFAGQPNAAGNICTEELVLLCEEMGIYTGVDLDPLIEIDPIANAVPREARDRMVARFDIATTQPNRALGYLFDVVLRGREATPFEDDHG